MSNWAHVSQPKEAYGIAWTVFTGDGVRNIQTQSGEYSKSTTSTASWNVLVTATLKDKWAFNPELKTEEFAVIRPYYRLAFNTDDPNYGGALEALQGTLSYHSRSRYHSWSNGRGIQRTQTSDPFAEDYHIKIFAGSTMVVHLILHANHNDNGTSIRVVKEYNPDQDPIFAQLKRLNSIPPDERPVDFFRQYSLDSYLRKVHWVPEEKGIKLEPHFNVYNSNTSIATELRGALFPPVNTVQEGAMVEGWLHPQFNLNKRFHPEEPTWLVPYDRPLPLVQYPFWDDPILKEKIGTRKKIYKATPLGGWNYGIGTSQYYPNDYPIGSIGEDMQFLYNPTNKTQWRAGEEAPVIDFNRPEIKGSCVEVEYRPLGSLVTYKQEAHWAEDSTIYSTSNLSKGNYGKIVNAKGNATFIHMRFKMDFDKKLAPINPTAQWHDKTYNGFHSILEIAGHRDDYHDHAEAVKIWANHSVILIDIDEFEVGWWLGGWDHDFTFLHVIGEKNLILFRINGRLLMNICSDNYSRNGISLLACREDNEILMKIPENGWITSVPPIGRRLVANAPASISPQPYTYGGTKYREERENYRIFTGIYDNLKEEYRMNEGIWMNHNHCDHATRTWRTTGSCRAYVDLPMEILPENTKIQSELNRKYYHTYFFGDYPASASLSMAGRMFNQGELRRLMQWLPFVEKSPHQERLNQLFRVNDRGDVVISDDITLMAASSIHEINNFEYTRPFNIAATQNKTKVSVRINKNRENFLTLAAARPNDQRLVWDNRNDNKLAITDMFWHQEHPRFLSVTGSNKTIEFVIEDPLFLCYYGDAPNWFNVGSFLNVIGDNNTIIVRFKSDAYLAGSVAKPTISPEQFASQYQWMRRFIFALASIKGQGNIVKFVAEKYLTIDMADQENLTKTIPTSNYIPSVSDTVLSNYQRTNFSLMPDVYMDINNRDLVRMHYDYPLAWPQSVFGVNTSRHRHQVWVHTAITTDPRNIVIIETPAHESNNGNRRGKRTNATTLNDRRGFYANHLHGMMSNGWTWGYKWNAPSPFLRWDFVSSLYGHVHHTRYMWSDFPIID